MDRLIVLLKNLVHLQGKYFYFKNSSSQLNQNIAIILFITLITAFLFFIILSLSLDNLKKGFIYSLMIALLVAFVTSLIAFCGGNKQQYFKQKTFDNDYEQAVKQVDKKYPNVIITTQKQSDDYGASANFVETLYFIPKQNGKGGQIVNLGIKDFPTGIAVVPKLTVKVNSDDTNTVKLTKKAVFNYQAITSDTKQETTKHALKQLKHYLIKDNVKINNDDTIIKQK